MDKYYIPQYLDTPPKIILWTLDEFIIFIVPFFSFFFVLNSPTLGMALGIIFVFLIKKIKGDEGYYYLKHLTYWYLPPIFKYKVTPHSCIRELLG